MKEQDQKEHTNSRIVLVTPEYYYGVEDWYIDVIECPKCKHKLPAIDSKYCSGCGVELKLSPKVKEYIGR